MVGPDRERILRRQRDDRDDLGQVRALAGQARHSRVAVHGKVHICGPDGEELEPGQDGLIFFENVNLPTYHNDPAKTAEAMHPKGWMTLAISGISTRTASCS